MSKSAPKAPDYEAAAREQAQSSREVTEQQTWANRPDQQTPWGSQTWASAPQWDPSTQQWLNRWTQTTQLVPEAQAALDSQLRLQRDRSQLGESLTGRMQNEYGSAMDWDSFRQPGGAVAPGNLTPEQLQRSLSTEGLPQLDPAQRYYADANDAIYNQWAERALPEQERQTEAARTRLYNMGLREGDEAFDREMENLGEQHSDALRQAQYQATIGAGQEAQRYLGMDASTRGQLFGERGTQGQFANQAAREQFGMEAQAGGQNFGQQMQASQYETQLRQQEIAEAMQRRGFSLNEINALLYGQQVAMPSMPGFNTAQRAEGYQGLMAAQLTGQAELDRFNAQQAAMQGMMSGIGSMAGGFMPG